MPVPPARILFQGLLGPALTAFLFIVALTGLHCPMYYTQFLCALDVLDNGWIGDKIRSVRVINVLKLTFIGLQNIAILILSSIDYVPRSVVQLYVHWVVICLVASAVGDVSRYVGDVQRINDRLALLLGTLRSMDNPNANPLSFDLPLGTGLRWPPRRRSPAPAEIHALVDAAVSPAPDPPTPCAVCRDESLSDQPWLRLRCSHHFHVQCARTWLLQNPTCPMCRASVIPEAAVPARPAADHDLPVPNLDEFLSLD